MKRICTICARGGSKGVEGKNLKPLLGVPLIAHSLNQAKEAKVFDLIAVSSDSAEILETARRYGADILVKRPSELASDHAPKVPVIRHCVSIAETDSGMKFDTCVDLDCTSPLRTSEDIKEALNVFESGDFENLVTATPSRRSPYFNMIEKGRDGKVKLVKNLENSVVRRQDAPKTYDMNASIYIWKRETLRLEDRLFLPTTQLFVMPEERSIDIDSDLDFKIVELLMKERK